MVDMSGLKTTYSYMDKQFLNQQFTKYGKFYIDEMLKTIHKLHIDELLPDILISIRNTFKSAKAEINKLKKQEKVVQSIILTSFIKYSDQIKQEQELTEAYEDILQILVDLNYEYAAVILDEFRIH